MDNWHDPDCRRPDLSTFGDLESCMNCGASHLWSQSAKVDTYIYKPLVANENIRLVTILPGSKNDPVVCKLSLALLSDHPDYYALSYTWADEQGDQESSSSILLDGYIFPVTANCLAALKQARNYDASKPIWIDSICIDQQKDLEKNHQVRIMPQIYAQAASVLIHVGDLDADEVDLLEFLRFPELPHYNLRDHSHDKSTLRRFLSRRWFSRVWVLQEVILAKTAQLLCGDFALRWSILYARCRDLLDIPRSRADRFHDGVPVVFQAEQLCLRKPGELLRLLDLARSIDASDPRDKVFALLGFTFQAEREGLEANYTKNVEQVYLEVAEALARRFGIAALFARSSLVDWYGCSDRLNDLKLPIWIPDWRRPRGRTFIEAYHKFAALHSEEAFAKSLPVRIDSAARTISFPVCDLNFIDGKETPPLWSKTFPNAHVVFDGLKKRGKLQLKKEPISKKPKGKASYFASKHKSSFLLPNPVREGEADFPYGVQVEFARDIKSKTMCWHVADGPQGDQKGDFGPYGLCTVYHGKRREIVWGMFPLVSAVPGVVVNDDFPAGYGTFRQIELTEDLEVN